jgi:hypothetical protein
MKGISMLSTILNGSAGELPDLIAFLSTAYRKEGKIPEGVQDSSDSFVSWAKSYLAKHRPSEVFAVDNNYGVQLNNGQRLQISPSASADGAVAGKMASQDSSIAIFNS